MKRIGFIFSFQIDQMYSRRIPLKDIEQNKSLIEMSKYILIQIEG